VDTVWKRNISGEDLEVSQLNYQIVKDGAVVELPTHYAWHVEPHGKPDDDDYDPGDEAPIVWPPSLWEDAKKPTKAELTAATDAAAITAASSDDKE